MSQNDHICLEIFHFILNENFLISKIEIIEQKIELLEFSQTEILEHKEHLLNRNLSFFVNIYNLFFALNFFFLSKKKLLSIKKQNELNLKKIQDIVNNDQKKPSDDEIKLLATLKKNIKESNKLLNEQVLTTFLIFVKIKSLIQENYQSSDLVVKEIYKESFPDILNELEELYLLQKDIENRILIMEALSEISLNIFDINKKETHDLEKKKKLTKNFL